MPVFLSGEKRQAVRTSTPIPPEKKVERVNKEWNHTLLQSHLYVTFHLCSTMKLMQPRSKYIVDLSKDLDDVEVSLLIKHGLGSRFPTACDAWKSRNIGSEETAQQRISEEKRRIDEELRNDQPWLEDILAKETTKIILDVCPYASLPKFYL